MSYVQQRTWLIDGPVRGLGETVDISYPWIGRPAVDALADDKGSSVGIKFPMVDGGGGSSGGSFNPFPFLEDSPDVRIIQPGGAAAAAGSLCWQVGFPWFGSRTPAGTCKPVVDVSPAVGVLVTALLVGSLFFRGVRR